MWSHKKIISHFIITGKDIFILKWVWTFSITFCGQKCRIFRIGQFWLLKYQRTAKLKNCSKQIYMRWNALNKLFLIVPMKNYPKITFPNQYITKKVLLKLTFVWLWSNCSFQKILPFWAQNVIENVLTHFKMKISFPMIMKCDIIFSCDHTYLYILTFTLHT